MSIDSQKMWLALEPLAIQHFKAETLETRNRDDLDFYDVAVWSIRDALIAAYRAGHEQGEASKLNELTRTK